MWRAYTGASQHIHCVFGKIPNLQNCFTTPGGLIQINTCRQVPLQVKEALPDTYIAIDLGCSRHNMKYSLSNGAFENST